VSTESNEFVIGAANVANEAADKQVIAGSVSRVALVHSIVWKRKQNIDSNENGNKATTPILYIHAIHAHTNIAN
jgi:hypothetical protein